MKAWKVAKNKYGGWVAYLWYAKNGYVAVSNAMHTRGQALAIALRMHLAHKRNRSNAWK